jgi:predicted signal transduction protein with EAL and GGDEF domain
LNPSYEIKHNISY